ncbi:C-C chemokine receptor type 3-like isoform X1 [Poecilia reticulata]|uniref:C-C chemokine receptor type 3-like n=1 Tax=Poecilia reticulata TaxID=8081 RepID=A0A3P9P672_POERE|nr:PREDICTED: C-C chemokine receptor type 3-like isoform X1 [Poecilia reticulata]
MTQTNISYVTSKVPEEPVEPCSRDDDNKLGANLSYIYYFMFVFSVIANLLVLVVIHRFEKLYTVINILLVNLVTSSLILMSSLPFQAASMQISDWIFGSAMCKIVFSAYYLGFYSSVFFLTLLTFDRYLAFVHFMPVLHVRSRRNAIISCVVVWVISGLACIRPMILHGTFKHFGAMYCEEFAHVDGLNVKMLKRSGFYIQLFVFLILPLAIIIFCYVRIVITIKKSRSASKFHAVRMIFMIVVLFFICWIPFNIVELLHYELESLLSCEAKQKLGYALHVTRNMAYIYFCISPMFYTFVGRKFQNHFKQLLVKCFPRLQDHISFNTDITTTHTSRTELSLKK